VRTYVYALTGKRRLHLACGDAYLRGWINVDTAGSLAIEAPEKVRRNSTSLEGYDTNHQGSGDDQRRPVVVDIRADLRDLAPFPDSCADQILVPNLTEHLRLKELPSAAAAWRRVLVDDGELLVDIAMAISHLVAGELIDRLGGSGLQLRWTRRDFLRHTFSAFQLCFTKTQAPHAGSDPGPWLAGAVAESGS
jgi:methyltransferase family protein